MRWTRMRLGRPSPGLIVAFIALMVALGGTAWAATTVVNIADPITPGHKATVDATGALKTAGTATVNETAPKVPWLSRLFLTTASANNVITANKATVALTRIDVDEYYGQTNGAATQISLYEFGGNATTCDGSSGTRLIGTYDVKPGETFADAMESPIVLKPLASNTVWCLTAFATVQGSPASYFQPGLATSGYVASGTLPSGAIPSSRVQPGAAPQRVTR